VTHATPSTYTNPVFAGYFADPFVWRHGRDYFAIGTGSREASGDAGGSTQQPSVFPLLRSRNLVDWESCGHALVRPDPTLGDTFWAPEIVQSGGLWYLYYSVGHGDRQHQLRVASSQDPLGPYTDVTALTSPDQVPFAIDPHPFRDSDGRWYLFHARDFLDLVDERGQEVRAGTALVVSTLHGMIALGDDTHVVARARCDWQRFAANRPMHGQAYDWHTLEGPCVIPHDGRYYCLYSGGCWQDMSYGVDYVVAPDVLGPWSDAGAELGPRVLRTIPGHVMGPGHCSVVEAPDRRAYICYHAWDPAMTARRFFVDELQFTPQGPRCLGPSWTPRPRPAVAGAT
jgi:beta-xylosidase